MLNPKLIPWLEAGIKRFAEQGIEDLNINELSSRQPGQLIIQFHQ